MTDKISLLDLEICTKQQHSHSIGVIVKPSFQSLLIKTNFDWFYDTSKGLAIKFLMFFFCKHRRYWHQQGKTTVFKSRWFFSFDQWVLVILSMKLVNFSLFFPICLLSRYLVRLIACTYKQRKYTYFRANWCLSFPFPNSVKC